MIGIDEDVHAVAPPEQSKRSASEIAEAETITRRLRAWTLPEIAKDDGSRTLNFLARSLDDREPSVGEQVIRELVGRRAESRPRRAVDPRDQVTPEEDRVRLVWSDARWSMNSPASCSGLDQPAGSVSVNPGRNGNLPDVS
jgi:hypothetical protein